MQAGAITGRRRPFGNIANTIASGVLFLDLDVKGGAYTTTDEAMRALIAVCVALGLPAPSIVIYSSAPGRRLTACRFKPLIVTGFSTGR